MNSQIKVLHFIWSANFGGIEKQIIDLCVAQNNKGAVSSAILIGCRKGSFMENLVDLGIKHFYADMTKGLELNTGAYKFCIKLMMNYDIIHIHTFNPLVLFAALKSGKKIIYTIHGNFQFGRKTTFNDRINNFLRKFFLNNYSDHITFNSEWSKKIAEERFGLKKNNKSVIYNGVSFENNATSSSIENTDHLNFIAGKFVIGTTCRFNGSKRIDRLIDAFSIFSKNKPDTILLLVGDGIDRNILENQTRIKQIDLITLFAGFQANVRGYQQIMDVCVFPFADEAFGLVAVETLSLGKPTILFADAGGMLEITGNDFKDDIVANVNDLVNRMEFYYNHKGSDSKENVKRRIEIALKFDLDTMENAYRVVYLQLLNN